ncbi:P15 protein [Spilosoma obliqua nucleopolyhedrosis virus]|nr:P15 protein [Spilosoma obliqua nucleopolyhedrosis virus]
MRTRSVDNDNKLYFLKALGLQPQEPLKRIACNVVNKCVAKRYKKFEGVATIKRELKRFNLSTAQFNEALYLCCQHNTTWRTTNNWDKCTKINEQYIYDVDFNAHNKKITERFYVCVHCFV